MTNRGRIDEAGLKNATPNSEHGESHEALKRTARLCRTPP
jgi:hypothetical protein